MTGPDSASDHPLPTGEQLLALESKARQQGSGLEKQDLLGCWTLEQIWAKGQHMPSTWSSGLLRSLQARLEISQSDDALLLSNAVTLGVLELRFHGCGTLLGRRPLLQFSFDQLQLRLAGRVLLQRALPALDQRRLPFFALIARDASGWLAARGRGGGLALWRLTAS